MLVAAFSLSFCPLLSSLACLALSRKSDLELWGTVNIVQPGKEEFHRLYFEAIHWPSACFLLMISEHEPQRLPIITLFWVSIISALTCASPQMQMCVWPPGSPGAILPRSSGCPWSPSGRKAKWKKWRLTCHLCSSGRYSEDGAGIVSTQG